MKKVILLLFLSFNCTVCLSYERQIEKLNTLTGKERWMVLKQFILEKESFAEPPNSEYKFLQDEILFSVGYSHGLRKIVEKKGKWIIDIDKEFIYFEIPNLWDDGFYKQKFLSYKIHCRQLNNKKYCQIIFFINKIFIEPKDEGERYSSGKYLHLSPKEK